MIGYGDIGQACARNAKAMGMNIVGQRRRPELSHGDGIADEVLGADQASNTLSAVEESARRTGGGGVALHGRRLCTN